MVRIKKRVVRIECQNRTEDQLEDPAWSSREPQLSKEADEEAEGQHGGRSTSDFESLHSLLGLSKFMFHTPGGTPVSDAMPDDVDETDPEGQQRKRRRQPGHLVLPGEIDTEQHLRDLPRMQRRADSQPHFSSFQVQTSSSSAGADERTTETWQQSPLQDAPTNANGRPPPTKQQSYTKEKKVEASAPDKDWNAYLCCRCGDGGLLLECDGTCLRCFHHHCLKPSDLPSPDDPPEALWYCPDCRKGVGFCAICKQSGVVGQHILKCKMGSCGLYYHNTCLNPLKDSGLLKIYREDPCVADGGNEGERVFACPAHFCHFCRKSGDARPLLRCWRCPSAYHKPCVPDGVKRVTVKNVECVECAPSPDASTDTAAVDKPRVWQPRKLSAADPSNQVDFDCGTGKDLTPKKRGRKPNGRGGNAKRSGSESSGDAGGSEGPPGGDSAGGPAPGSDDGNGGTGCPRRRRGRTGGGGGGSRDGPRMQLTTDAAQRPTRAAAMEAKIEEEAAKEEAYGCVGRIVPLQGNSKSKELVGKTVFTFGTNKKSSDFYVPLDYITRHSQLLVHLGGRVTIEFCTAQARQSFPITIIHAEGDPTTLTSTSVQSVPLRHQDVLTIAGACFIFQRVGIEDAIAAQCR